MQQTVRLTVGEADRRTQFDGVVYDHASVVEGTSAEFGIHDATFDVLPRSVSGRVLVTKLIWL